jgi:hypothetical protein
MWMHRFVGWAKPSTNQKDSSSLIDEFDELREVRMKTDTAVSEWAECVQDRWLQEDQIRFSVSVGREMRTQCGILVVHFLTIKPIIEAKRMQ